MLFVAPSYMAEFGVNPYDTLRGRKLGLCTDHRCAKQPWQLRQEGSKRLVERCNVRVLVWAVVWKTLVVLSINIRQPLCFLSRLCSIGTPLVRSEYARSRTTQ